MEETLYWYDLETFGRNPAWDRVSQFAGIRTDQNFNIIGEPLVLYCKITPDYIPDPGACYITGITPQKTIELGLNEDEFIKRIDKEFSVPGTCVVGFNSINFDDEFIRNLYYRNFKDPYLREWNKGNSRWDIINLIRGVHDFRPDGINWLRDSDNRPVFKLEELTKANGISHENAHDALSDVEATIAMARKVHEAQPKFFAFYYTLKKKERVKKYIDIHKRTPFYHTSPMFTSEKGCTTMLCPLAVDPINKNAIICFDLRYSPKELIELDVSEIKNRVFTPQNRLQPGINRINLKSVHLNKSPMVSPLGTLTAERSMELGIDTTLCFKHLDMIKDMPLLTQKVVKIYEDKLMTSIQDPDMQIYSGGFFRDEDKAKFTLIHNTRKEDLFNLNLTFTDSRVSEMLWRFVCRNYPEVLPTKELERWKSFCASRTLYPPVKDGLDFKTVLEQLDQTMNSKEVSNRDKIIAKDLIDYILVLKSRVLS
ncbi:MAG: exodeoxyribonuclease I [Spirochaetaceae bacterium 4572_7]|nr:MAG: exodeoxyribonuclease I [Spirochaetaceae bacterium 4572_7]